MPLKVKEEEPGVLLDSETAPVNPVVLFARRDDRFHW
jgi:hypothetical protein